MMKCSNCGSEIKDSTEFCPNCGNKVKSDEKIKCSNCGNELNKDATFCPNCGNEVKNTVKCEKCGNEVSESMEFCPSCGSNLKEKESGSKYCPKCGSELEEDSIFCIECGMKIDSETSQPQKNVQNVNQSFTDKINFNKIIKPTIIAVIAAILLSIIGVILYVSWIQFIFALIIAVGFFTALMDNEANAMISGLIVGLILGILENPIIEFCWGTYVAIAYEWYFGGQILLLIIIGIIMGYVANVYLKDSVYDFTRKNFSRLLKYYD